MSKITTIGQIPFYAGGQNSGSVNPPTITDFRAASVEDSQNEVTFYFAVSNRDSITFYSVLINDDGSGAGQEQSFDVTNATSYPIIKDSSYRTKVRIEATNGNGTVASSSITIAKATPDLQIDNDQLIASLSITRPESSFDRVSIDLVINKTAKFSLANLSKISLLNQREDLRTWQIIPLSVSIAQEIKQNDQIVQYRFLYDRDQSVQFLRPSIGGFFNFQVKISVQDFSDVTSETKKIYYDDLDPSQVDAQPGSSFPKAEIVDKFTSLRYEIITKLYQIFILVTNYKETANNASVAINETATAPIFNYKFLDETDVAKLGIENYVVPLDGSSWLFPQEFNNSKTDGSTKGFMYPASVSTILPCILPEGGSGDNYSIVFFWKINDDFYDYSYLKNQVSILTKSFKVKLQYKQGGSYVDLTNAISLERKIHYQSSTNKFILKIKRDVDVLADKRSLFNSILESDNATDTVRFLVVEHNVVCVSYYGAKEYTFDKLLLPPKWTYIAYDKYIPKNAVARKNNKIELPIYNSSLRGIVLPDQGFKNFDKIVGITSWSPNATSTYDWNIIYKVSSEFNGYYKDPVIEGTVNSVVIPKIPDDVFLIPPSVKLPDPNFLTISQGGRKADARVNLDEYGKIKAVEMVDPGGGYSLYSNQLDKRKQTFTDFVPAVMSSYRINARPVTYSKAYLKPSNSSFISLVASLNGGVRVASVDADVTAMGDLLTESQKEEIKEYISGPPPQEDSQIEDLYSVYEEREPAVKLIQDMFDSEWYEVSRLYQEKYDNPMDAVSIYSEDEDPASSQLSDSSVSSAPLSSEASATPTSAQAGSTQNSENGGPWQFFALNNLPVVPDGSVAVSVTTSRIAPPHLTLLPLAVRRDGERGYGPLPNMKPRAEMFNRIVSAINNLNEVRVIVPYIWLVTTRSKNEAWITPSAAYSLTEEVFNSGGTKYENSVSISDNFSPINAGFSVGASRSVGKRELKSSEVSSYGLAGGIYAISSQSSTSQSFTPKIHPLMLDAIPNYMSRGIKKRILGVVSTFTYNCASTQTPVSQYLGVPALSCATRNGNVFEKPFPASYPDTVFSTDSYFEFFDSGGSISASPRGTARFVGIQIEKYNNEPQFCYASCGDADYKSIDFTYANMFPATFKL
jgi:hypothetical protein